MRKRLLKISVALGLLVGIFALNQLDVFGNFLPFIMVDELDESLDSLKDTTILLTSEEEEIVEMEGSFPAVGEMPAITVEGTIVAVLDQEFLFLNRLNVTDEELEQTIEEWLVGSDVTNLMRLSNIDSDLEVGTQLQIEYTVSTFSIPPLVPVQAYSVIK